MKLIGLATFLVAYISDNNPTMSEEVKPFGYIDAINEEGAVLIAQQRMGKTPMGYFRCIPYISDQPKREAYSRNNLLPGVEKRNCKRCQGEGTTFRQGFTYDGKTYPDKHETCTRCGGVGFFSTPDYKGIFLAVTTGRGMPEGKRKVRASPDKKWNQYNSTEGARNYYVWRNARFSGGKDVTIPMMAGIAIAGDPFEAELQELSDIIAKWLFGTDMAGAVRWGALLGAINDSTHTIPQNLPPTAYEGGPVKM